MTNRLKILTLGSLLIVPVSCGDASKLSESIDEATAAYDSFDLSCSFEDYSGSVEAEEEAGASLIQDEETYDCAETSEQYTMMVSEYDTDGDNSLNNEELAEAEAEFEDAKLSSMDTNGDSSISEDERKNWRSKELPGRASKRQDHFKKSCEKIGKSTEECRMMRDERKQKHKEEVTTRIAEFDTDKDGKLNPEERKAMNLALDKEREKRRDDFVSKHDKDGDGKFGPKEKEARKEDREGMQGPKKSPPPAKK